MRCLSTMFSLVLLAALGVVAGGCASGSPTDQYAINMLVTRDGLSAQRIDVQPNGTVRYAGGRDAMADRYSWTGQLDADEQAEFDELMRGIQWNDAHTVERGSEDDISYDIRTRGPDGRTRLKLDGESPAIADLRAWLEQIARRRLDDDDTLRRIQPSLDER